MRGGASGGPPGAALPTADDLWGAGWDLDGGDDPRSPSWEPTTAAPLTALPDGFPDEHVLADADRTWTRSHPPALVHTVALAFDDALAAQGAAAMLATPAFAARLAEDVAVDAPVASGGMLLPPVVRRLPDLDAGGGAAAVAAHRAAFSFADERGALPIVLDVAVLRSATTVVLVTAVTPGDRDDDAGWRRLVAAVARRAHGHGSEREPRPG